MRTYGFTVGHNVIYELHGRGVIVHIDQPLPATLHVGQQLELRRPDGTSSLVAVAGILFVSPLIIPPPEAILLKDISPAELPVGTEIWLV